MIDIFIAAAALLVTLGILVTFHEYGHFWVARRCGVKVLRFSVGFGKPLKSWFGKDGTEYVIAPIPLGGYVTMQGMEETSLVDPSTVPAEQRDSSFACKPLWQRSAIVAAGPVANFLLAFLFFWLLNVAFGSSGIVPVVQYIEPDSVAGDAGLRTGDRIVAVDGRPVTVWRDVGLHLLTRLGETGSVDFTIEREAVMAPREIRVPIEDWLASDTEPQPLAALGIIDVLLPPRIGTVEPGSPAEAGGLQAGDLIVSVDGLALRDWRQWVRIVRASPELDLLVVVERAEGPVELLLRPESVSLADGEVRGRTGVSVATMRRFEAVAPEAIVDVRYGPLAAIVPALQETWEMSLFVLDSVGKLVLGMLSVEHVSGPLTIAQVAGETATTGIQTYIAFLALLSISLGILNLLPIPVLDGGHLFFFLIEAIIRRPLPEVVQVWSLRIGIAMIAGIMLLAFYNDFNRLL